MENASKFLYVIGGILIALMILMLMVYLFASGSMLTAGFDIKISDEMLKAYNAEFEAFSTKDYVLATDIVTLVNKAKDINEHQAEAEQDYITIEINFENTTDSRCVGKYVYNQEIDKEDNAKNILARKNSLNKIDIKDFLKLYSTTEAVGTKINYIDRFKCDSIQYSNRSGKVNKLTFIYPVDEKEVEKE